MYILPALGQKNDILTANYKVWYKNW
jgi:hypothetical protein